MVLVMVDLHYLLIPFIFKILLVAESRFVFVAPEPRKDPETFCLPKSLFIMVTIKALNLEHSLSFLPNGCCMLTYLFNHEIYLDTDKRFSEKYPLNVNHTNRQTSVSPRDNLQPQLTRHLIITHLLNTSVVKLTYSSDAITCIVEDRSMHDKVTKQE